MAHKKAGGAQAQQGANVRGKRMGIKIFGGQVVKTGQIILRQKGKKYLPGENVGIGRDYTIFSMINGIVEFVWENKRKKKINVRSS